MSGTVPLLKGTVALDRLDAANYLLASIHGLPDAEADALLIRRIGQELAHVPAFNESISTLTGKPHGHILYSWNSGYQWLRRETRRENDGKTQNQKCFHSPLLQKFTQRLRIELR